MNKRDFKGFSLIEVALAVSLFAVCGLALIGVLGVGLNESQRIQSDNVATLISRQFQTRMRDPQWPLAREPNGAFWKSTIYTDYSGTIIEKPELASLVLELTSGTSNGFDSPRLERVRCDIFRFPEHRKIGTFAIQRRAESREP